MHVMPVPSDLKRKSITIVKPATKLQLNWSSISFCNSFRAKVIYEAVIVLIMNDGSVTDVSIYLFFMSVAIDIHFDLIDLP